ANGQRQRATDNGQRTTEPSTAERSDAMQDFIQAIADEHVYLFDGAMGTMLYSKGVFVNKCYDELNLRNPEIVLEVHKQYVRCGAEILETNTYGANRVKLRTFGIEDDLREINLKAVEI